MSQWPGKVVPLIACSSVIRLPWRLSPHKEKTHIKQHYVPPPPPLTLRYNPHRAYLATVRKVTHLNPGSHFNQACSWQTDTEQMKPWFVLSLLNLFEAEIWSVPFQKTSAETTLVSALSNRAFTFCFYCFPVTEKQCLPSKTVSSTMQGVNCHFFLILNHCPFLGSMFYIGNRNALSKETQWLDDKAD